MCHIFHLVAEAFGRNRGRTFGRVRDGKRKGRKKKTEERVGSVRNWWGLVAPQQLLPVFLSLSQHLVFWWDQWGRCVCVRGVFGTLFFWYLAMYSRLFLHPGELVWNSCPPKVYLDCAQQKNRTATPHIQHVPLLPSTVTNENRLTKHNLTNNLIIPISEAAL